MIGFDRLDAVAQVKQLNRVYDKIWLYFFFQPMMRLTQEYNEDGDLNRRQDDVQTPFQRICASGVLDDVKLAALTQLYRETNPLTLREAIDHEIDALL